ncbi:structural protein [Lactococcus phage LW4]|uniref:Structural protein n=4 Tax=Teubervirus LW31 TaxID=2845420 RepID=A0A1W6JI11_9CAUD|nr:virion structural protein [Lactococcus phage LW31]ARM65685.1 structural protein [Lactococcus phage LW31]ARM65772.1 structural protein [Lactococcus phage LW32]ARM65858.1 structural protein [Lactococcus phage LW33]ARM65930.1 structural protein [Lactococcus phage LW4]
MSNTAPFLHIAYANNDTGTLDFTTKGGIERTYTGFYTDEYSTDSSDPTKYKWLTNAEFKNKVNTAAYAKSADGKDSFTTVYPNLNLLSGTSTKVVQATSWNMEVADIKYDKSLGGALCASVWFNNADHASDLLRGSATIMIQTLDQSGKVLATIYGNSVASDTNGLSQCHVTIDDNTASAKVVIFTNNMNQNAFYSRLKIEKGTVATPYMKSASEVKDSDYPQYIGFSNVTNPTTFKDYEWALLESVPKKILNTHVAYANSADGTDGFTTVYPNLNLLQGTKDFKPIAAGNNSPNQNAGNIYFTQYKTVADLFKEGDYANISYDIEFLNTDLYINSENVFTTIQMFGGAYTWLSIIKIKNVDGKFYIKDGFKDYDYVENPTHKLTVSRTIQLTKDFINANGFVNNIQLLYNNIPLGANVKVTNLKIEQVNNLNSGKTPWMPSANEVKDSDYPKFVGVYGDDSTIASQIPAAYKWSSIPKPGPTPPVIPNLYVLTMPTVKSINITYGIGTLTTKPVIWLSAKPKLDVNQVLWYKSEITGTDNSVGVYYSNLVGGANLDDGDSPLDNTVVSIVLNNKIVNVPRDLALKLELLSQTLNKRDNELAQLIADTNDRISNIDLGSGQAGLNREVLDRENADNLLGVRIDTVTGDVNDLKNNTQTKFTNIEKQLGGFSVQGTKNNSLTRPSIVFDYNAYGTILPDGSTDGGGRLYYQVPGDTTYAVRELKFNYQTLPSFYDRDQIMIWEDSWSKLYGGFPWRDTIVTTTDVDKFYIDGMTTYYDYNGDLVIRGRVVLDGIDDWIGSMSNRGFKPDTVAITVASDLKSVKSIRLTGEMGVIEMSMSLGYGTGAQVQRLGRQVSFCGPSQLNRFSSTGDSWTNLNDKIPYGLRPTRSFEFATNMFGNNNSIQYAFDSNGGIKLHQSINNANQYQVMGQVSWQTFDQYPPIGYASKPDWVNR